jgi:hypothetical protein
MARDATSTAARARADVAALARTALTTPRRVPASAVDRIVSALGRSDDAAIVHLALSALAAITYSRPDLIGHAAAARLGRRLTSTRALRDTSIAQAWRCLLFTPGAATAARALVRALSDRTLTRETRTGLLDGLRHRAHWRPDRIDVQAMVEIARAVTPGERALILRDIVERVVFAAPRRFKPVTIRRMIAAFHDCPRLRYTLDALAARRGVDRRTASSATRWLAGRFPARDAAAVLRRRPFSLLVLHNIDDDLNDEIVRVSPLVQALLDSNPGLGVTMFSRRTYLYDHPRVAASSIHDEPAVERSLRFTFDGVVSFHERGTPAVNSRPELAPRLAGHLANRSLALVVEADKGHNHFVFHTVRVAGRSLARSRRLDRADAFNIYDGAARLVSELGLCPRAAEERPTGGSLLVGRRSPQAEMVWQRLRGRGGPVALVNAFGARDPLEGFTGERLPRLAREVGGLVDEGFQVVLLPNGEVWGGRDVVSEVLRRVDRRRRTRVVIAPDPRGHGDSVDVALTERPALHPTDRAMRLFKYFASYADLVVTVEGWMMHLAYALGRPFRMLLAPYSCSFDRHPPGRGEAQRLVATLSTRSGPDAEGLLGHGHGHPSPSPNEPRKSMLMAALGGMAHDDGGLLAGALEGADADLRAIAIEALGTLRPLGDARRRVLGGLADRTARVRAAAARALLVASADCTEVDPRYRAHLEAHCAIARQDWPRVQALGRAALPALAVAVEDVDDGIRREARVMAARLLQPYVAAVPARA